MPEPEATPFDPGLVYKPLLEPGGAALMIEHIMKDPEDLDQFSDEQMPITRVLEDGGKKKIERLVMSAAGIQLKIDIVALRQGFSAEEWQRAAYEALQLHKSDPSPGSKVLADSLWFMVQYLQASIQLVRESTKDPEIVKVFKERGIPLPTEDEG